MAGLIGNIELYLPAGSEYTFPITGGMIAIASETIQNACALVAFPLYGGGCAVSNILGDLYVEGNVTTSYKMSCWRDEQGCHIRNNWPNSGFRFYYSVVGSKVQ